MLYGGEVTTNCIDSSASECRKSLLSAQAIFTSGRSNSVMSCSDIETRSPLLRTSDYIQEYPLRSVVRQDFHSSQPLEVDLARETRDLVVRTVNGLDAPLFIKQYQACGVT